LITILLERLCQLASNETSYVIKNIELAQDQTLSIKFSGRNPSKAGESILRILSYSSQYNAIIDQGFINIFFEDKSNKLYF